MMKKYISGSEIEYSIVRSRRKTIGIRVSREDGVVVSAPLKLSSEYIEGVVVKKAAWILQTLKKIEASKRQEKQYVNGETFLFLGKKYCLEIIHECSKKQYSVFIDGDKLCVCLPSSINAGEQPPIVRKALAGWYIDRASNLINERIGLYSDKMNVKPSKVVLKSQKTLWGSCTGKNAVNINWKIVMAPLEIVDYLVVHELAHIKVKNHSKAYWDVVKSIIPDFRERRKWLKENGNYLRFD